LKDLPLSPLESISLLGRPCGVSRRALGSSGSISAFPHPLKPPCTDAGPSAWRSLSVILAAGSVLLGTPNIARWAGALLLPRLLIFQTPVRPQALGRMRSGQRDLQEELSSFSPVADAIEASKTDVTLSCFGSAIGIGEA